MSYIVNKTSGQALVTILDGTTDTSTGVILIGRNYTNYGEFQNENFVRLMENFAGTAPPGQSVGQYALAGQVWYDTSTSSLKVYNGATWSPVSGFISSETAPYWSSIPTGFQWWDSVNQQLYVYNGTDWSLVGPSASVLFGKSGALVETVYDQSATAHTITKIYSRNNCIAIFSNETFTPNVAITNFTNGITKGLTLAANTVVAGTATNADRLGDVAATNYIRSDVSVGLQYDLSVAGTIGTNGAYIEVDSEYDALQIQNTNLNGSTDFYNNVNGTITNTMHIDGASGYVTVALDPVNNLGVATKQYVDTMSSTVANLILEENNSLVYDFNLFKMYIDANVGTLAIDVETISSNLNALTTHVNNDMAPLASPTLVGSPKAPTVPHWTGNSQIATTYYVDRQDQEVLDYANLRLTNLTANLEARLTRDEQTFAPNASPQFSGIPTAPTPGAGDASNKIATTAFVYGTQPYWSGPDANNNYVHSKRFISTNPPNNSIGNDGDFWFQIVP